MKNTVILSVLGLFIMLAGCKQKAEKELSMEDQFKEFVQQYEQKVVPLSREMNEAYFTAAVSGKKEDYDKAAELEIKLSKIYADTAAFAQLKKFKESGEIKDELLKRELEVMYNRFLAKQIDPARLEKVIKMQNEIEQMFSTYRAIVGEDTLTDNEVEEILKTSTDNKRLEAVWKAHKAIGPVVADKIIQLVKLRNEIARDLGFSNYHEMSLRLDEQDPGEIEALFNELDAMTRDAYIQVKQELDEYLARRYHISPDQLMPWHYQNRYFQEAPKMYKVDLDKYFKDQNIEELTTKYYSSLGLDITDLLEKSDLYEKPGKNQHAFCIDIDNKGDVRVLCNIKPNYYWMNTMLHEFGHAVYDKYIDTSLPFILAEPAHTFTTEAIAQMFGKMAANPQWLLDMGLIDENEKESISEESFKTQRLEQLVFSRWSQVMYRFEKALYENPEQDLNTLWWQLVEEYQMVKKPEGRNEPDWATKIHIATVPCYYHNYLLGELLASQLYVYICRHVLQVEDIKNQSFKDKKEVGQYLVEKVFKPGARWSWNDMIVRATGEPLVPVYYMELFVQQ